YLPDDPNIETDVQFGVTKRLLGDYVRHENEKTQAPGVKDTWFKIDSTFIMEPGTAKLPRAPIEDKATTTQMRPKYLAAARREPEMAKQEGSLILRSAREARRSRRMGHESEPVAILRDGASRLLRMGSAD